MELSTAVGGNPMGVRGYLVFVLATSTRVPRKREKCLIIELNVLRCCDNVTAFHRV